MKEGAPKQVPKDEEVDTSELQAVAKRVLNEEGQLQLEEMLDEDKVHLAKVYLLGAIDACFDKGTVSFEEAAEFYKKIGLSPEYASQLRQNHSKR